VLNERGKAFLRLFIMLLIQFILFMLKITGAINWSWVVVLIPIWIIIFWELSTTVVMLWLFRK
jgi:hypothetical protein